MNKLLSLFIVILIVGCVSPQSGDYSTYKTSPLLGDIKQKKIEVFINRNQPLKYRGSYDYNHTIDQGQMMYQGFAGTEGMIAQVITHAYITAYQQEEKLSQNQIEANKVLIPFNSSLNNLTHDMLVHHHPYYIFSQNSVLTDAILLKSTPIFYISQDLNSLSLKHQVEAIYNGEIIYKNLIEIVAPKSALIDLKTQLHLNNTTSLSQLSKSLYENSLTLAINDIHGNFSGTSAQKTYSFNQRFERGALIESNANTTVIRNLRGWIISFPNNTVDAS